MRVFWAFGLAWMAVLSPGLGGRICAQAGDVPPPPRRVVLIQPEGQPVRPGLEPSLRIQLRGAAEVLATTATPFPPDLPSRLTAASAIAEQQHADWVLWTDPIDPGAGGGTGEPADVVMYLVGRRNGRALIEVVRVPAGEGPEVDRSLALKVHALIDVSDGAAYALGNAEVPEPAPPQPAPPAAEPANEAAPRARVQLWLEGGAQLAVEGDAGAAVDLLLALGPSISIHSLVIALPIELSVGLPRSIEQSGDEARWSELGVALWAKLGARLDRLWLGGGIGGRLVFTDVEGTTEAGRSGSARDLLPAVLASIDGELLITESVGARLAAGSELRLGRRRFVLEGTDIGDTGRVVPFARLSLVWHAL